jgi:hypothetical protein
MASVLGIIGGAAVIIVVIVAIGYVWLINAWSKPGQGPP